MTILQKKKRQKDKKKERKKEKRKKEKKKKKRRRKEEEEEEEDIKDWIWPYGHTYIYSTIIFFLHERFFIIRSLICNSKVHFLFSSC